MSQAQNNKIRVALIGNPNAGKSSLFNALTGLNQKTGNYSGVTVDKHEGFAKHKEFTLSVIDLPGTYSLFPKSIDEQIACDFLLNENPDVVVIVADATNLKRNLLLATQVIDLKLKTVLTLNMIDEAKKQQIIIDTQGLSETLGVTIVTTNSRSQEGIAELKEAIVSAKPSQSYFYNLVNKPADFQYNKYLKDTYTKTTERTDEINVDQLYRFNTINYMVAKYVKSPAQLSLKELTAKIDRFTTHRIFGYVFLLFVLFLVFQFIFYVAEYPMSWIENGFIGLQNIVSDNLPKGQVNDLITNGVISGISGVVMFVPQIALLFLFIGILEDSGYMARASFIMDKIMRRFGLNGKSVIPLISGTACAVPSIMATRSISNYKERLITVFVLPLISCSARLPVYTLIIALLYPNNTFWGIFNVKGLVLMMVYLLGFAVTLITAFFLQKLIKARETSFFIMEMPVYRWPQTRNIGLMVWGKIKVFIKDAGKIIFALSIVLWFLSSHGPGEQFKLISDKIEAAYVNENSAAGQEEIQKLKTQQLEHSYVGILGHYIEPAIRPLGFDWKIGISLITSFAAREVFVGTMATIYGGNSEDDSSIKQKLESEKRADGKPVYNQAVCWSLLLFYAFALQCMSTIATVKRETKSWKWPLVQLVFMTGLAYLSAFAAFQLLS